MQIVYHIENDHNVDTLDVRYFTSKRGITRTKHFSSIGQYRRWEKSVTKKNYGITDIKPTYKAPAPDVMPKETKEEDLPSAKPGHFWKRNLLSQNWFQIEENTPRSCDPSSELYWCM